MAVSAEENTHLLGSFVLCLTRPPMFSVMTEDTGCDATVMIPVSMPGTVKPACKTT